MFFSRKQILKMLTYFKIMFKTHSSSFLTVSNKTVPYAMDCSTMVTTLWYNVISHLSYNIFLPPCIFPVSTIWVSTLQMFSTSLYFQKPLLKAQQYLKFCVP